MNNARSDQPYDQPSDQPSDEASQSYQRRIHAFVVVGMALSVASLFLAWQKQPLSSLTGTAYATALPGAMYTEQFVYRTGFQSHLQWPITLGAVIAGALNIAPLSDRNRTLVTIAQTVSCLLLLVVVLRFFVDAGYSLLPGYSLCLIGALSIVFGTLERWRMPV